MKNELIAQRVLTIFKDKKTNMRTFTAFIFCLLLCFGCQNDSTTNGGQSSITTLENQYENERNTDNLRRLLESYRTDTTGAYDYKLAQLELNNNQIGQALSTIKKALKKKADAKFAMLLAGVYEKSNLRDAATVAYKTFLEAFPNDAAAVLVQEKITTPQTLDTLMQQLFEETYNDSLKRVELAATRVFIECGETYALLLPNKGDVPMYLRRVARAAESIRQPIKELEIHDWIISKYPNSKEAEQSLFKSAFIYENQFSNLEEAGKRYRAYIQKYPNSDLADDAQITLDNLGKDPAEMLKAIQNRNQ